MNDFKHTRRSIRLKGYDYSQPGAYFITICTQNRECMFGEIIDGEMALNDAGRIVENEWLKTDQLRQNIKCDIFVVMPNHFHGIIVITEPVGAIHESPQRMTITERRNMTLPKIVGRFKMQTSKQINIIRGTLAQKLWQRNYYEHIIRNENDYNRIYEYIQNNPLKWELDSLRLKKENK